MFSAAVAIAYAAWVIRTGVRLAMDTPTSSHWADILIGLDFNFFAYLEQQNFAAPLFNLAWITVVALMKVTFGASWMTGIVILNWVALSAGAYAICESVRTTTRSGASMLLAAMLLLVAGDLLIFVPFVRSDLMFWALSTAALACGVSLASSERSGWASHVSTVAAGTVFVVLATMVRPVGLPLIVFWLLSLCTLPARHIADRFATPILVLGVAVATVAMVVHASVLLNPTAWFIGPLPAGLAVVAADYRAGMFVHQSSPPMLVEPAVDLAGFLRITLQKLIFFFTPWLPHYSAAHTMLNLAFFLPAYGLSIAAISRVARLSLPQRRAVVVLALFVMSTSMFHAMLLVDSDHRYRLPMLPAIIMLAAIGLESVRRPETLASTGRRR